MRSIIPAFSLTLLLPAGLFAQPATTEPTAPGALTTPTPAPESATVPSAGTEPTAPHVIVLPEEPEEPAIDIGALIEEELPRFQLGGYYRVRANVLNSVGLDDEITRFFEHRLRFEPKFNLGPKVSFQAQIDALDDGIWGANPGNVLTQSTSDPFPNVVVKRAYGEATLPFGLVSAGRQPSHWGMGLLANHGNGFPEFGDYHDGSTADRLIFATKPLGPDSKLITAILYDKMVANQPLDIANTPSPLLSAQPNRAVSPANKTLVDEAIGVVYFNTDPLKIGVYQLWRWEDDEGKTAGRYELIRRGAAPVQKRFVDAMSVVRATDFFFAMDLGTLYGETEQIWLWGETNAVPVLDQADFSTANTRTKISQRGYAARLGLRMEHYNVEFEWGSASGDRNGFADVENGRKAPKLTNMKFHPDYNVGLIMFEYAAAAHARRQIVAQLASLDILERTGLITAENKARVESIAELGLTNGSVTNALYLNPKLRFNFLEKKLGVTLAYLTAWAHAPTVIRRGRETQEFDDYGHEVDAAINYRFTEKWVAGLQAGYFWPGGFFNTQDIVTGQVIEPTEDGVLLQGRLTWEF